MDEMTGGDRIAAMLAAEGVDTVFGIIDGSYYGLYSSLGTHGIRLITPRHETSAVHMAGAYARTTGGLGVCIASNGPGAANALPGVAVENGEGNRVLLITSWRRSAIVGPDRGGTYQYFDQPAVIAAMSKSSEAVASIGRLPEAMARAFRHCWSGRPGVVHVTVPEDIINGGFPSPARPDPRPAQYRRQHPIAADPARRATGGRSAGRRRVADDPCRHRCRARRCPHRTAPGRRVAGGTGHHQLGWTRLHRRAAGGLDPDVRHRARRPSPQRVRSRARPGHPVR